MDDRSKKILELACKFIEKQGCLWAEFDAESYNYQFYGGRRFQCGTSEKEQGSKMNLPFEIETEASLFKTPSNLISVEF